jgi:hypothetical protein
MEGAALTGTAAGTELARLLARKAGKPKER